MWYPEQRKASDLVQALVDTRRSWSPTCVSPQLYKEVSAAIHRLIELAPRDPYFIRDWVWIAAQLRIAHPEDEAAARVAWAGLSVFVALITNPARSADVVSALRFLTDRVVEDLIQVTGPHAGDRFVSSLEQQRIDDLLLELTERTEPELPTLIKTADRMAELFASIHHAAYFPSVAAKLRTLAQIAGNGTEAACWAEAALRYLHLERDVVDDRHGYLGYLDDIQVIEDVYELARGARSWKPLLNAAVTRWPMLVRVHWTDGETTNHLPPFLKATAACALQAAEDGCLERFIVIPEIGPVGFVSAALCALSDLRTEHKSDLPRPGTVVAFRRGRLTRFIVMEKPYDVGDGTQLPMVRVRDGSISIPAQYAILLEAATVKHPNLATSREVEEWIRTLEVEGLAPAWKYRRASDRPAVLYVTDRSRFFEALSAVRMFGRRLDELVPVAYYTRGAHTAIGTGAATVTPAMIVCNDLATAETFLGKAAGGETPRYVMVDRSVDPSNIRGLASRCRRLDSDVHIVTFTTPDAIRRISGDSQDAGIWLIRPGDVDPILSDGGSPGARVVGRGLLATFCRRQATSGAVRFQTVPVHLEELDRFAALADEITYRALRNDDRELETVAIACEALLRQISSQAPVGERLLNERIEAALTNIKALASVHGLFDREVAELEQAAHTLVERLKASHPKDEKLRALLQRYPEASVLVTSRALARELNTEAPACSPRRPRFLVIEDLDQADDIDVLIVPAWFGTQTMRRLEFGGWARLQIRVLFAYEIVRLQRLNRRLVRDLRDLNQKTRESWKRFAAKVPEIGSPPQTGGSEEGGGPEGASKLSLRNREDRDDADWLETAVRNRVFSSSQGGRSRDLVGARLIFFDDGIHFGVFANDASVVCLNEVFGGGSDMTALGEAEADKLLWKKVNELAPGDILAFPDDPAHGDVIDSLADALLGDNGRTRQLAGLWREAAREIVKKCNWDFEQARQVLADAGVDRTASTLASWLYSTKTVAPKRSWETIPALLKCAALPALSGKDGEILKATRAVYAARRRASHVLVTQLLSASINAPGGAAVVPINGAQVRYRLLTVETVDGTALFSSRVLGLHTTEEKLVEVAA